MICCVYGFPNKLSALRFEWAWQNPSRSRRIDVPNLGNDGSVGAKFRVLATMLRAPTWRRLPLTVNWISRRYAKAFEDLRLPQQPTHMCTAYGPIRKSTLKCADVRCSFCLRDKVPVSTHALANLDTEDNYVSESTEEQSDTDELIGLLSGTFSPESSQSRSCMLCDEDLEHVTGASRKQRPWSGCTKPACPSFEGQDMQGRTSPANRGCEMVAHLACLAEYFLDEAEENDRLIPVSGECPACNRVLLWGELVRGVGRF